MRDFRTKCMGIDVSKDNEPIYNIGDKVHITKEIDKNYGMVGEVANTFWYKKYDKWMYDVRINCSVYYYNAEDLLKVRENHIDLYEKI